MKEINTKFTTVVMIFKGKKEREKEAVRGRGRARAREGETVEDRHAHQPAHAFIGQGVGAR